MRRTLVEILGYLVVGSIITVGAVVLGARMIAPSMSAAAPPDLRSGSCLDEPFVPVRGSLTGALARLCFGVDDLRPRIELTGLASGTLLTAWITHVAQPPPTQRERCEGAAISGTTMTWARPIRIDAAITDQTGHVQFTTTMREPRLPGGSVVQLLVVDHGLTGLERGAARLDEAQDWVASWYHGSSVSTRDRRQEGRLLGCADFWLRGGVESQRF